MENHLKHLCTGKELSAADIQKILDKALHIKQHPDLYHAALANKTLVMMFEKPSFRTRLSFSAAIQKMGGNIIESIGSTRKFEEPKDTIQVLNGYCDIMMLRTHEDDIFDEMAQYAKIPIINALSELYHPCQIMADMLSLYEAYGKLEGLKLSYIGDGNNILNSLMLMLPLMKAHVHYACPKNKTPSKDILAQCNLDYIKAFDTAQEAVQGTDAVYTDVWVSMGFDENTSHIKDFEGFQVNEALMQKANTNAVFMHCMPMIRNQEVTDAVADSDASIIYRQAENRLYVQQAIILHLLNIVI